MVKRKKKNIGQCFIFGFEVKRCMQNLFEKIIKNVNLKELDRKFFG